MKNDRIRKVLILGSGALKIGEAGEFDYSGSQAIKALKEEGIKTVLVNPNIATIQTSDYLADEIYFLPITPQFVEGIIAKERPEGILLSFGGQTALNCGLSLHDAGILKIYNVQVLGTPVRAIQETEDRELFIRRLEEIGVKVPQSAAVTLVEEAVTVAEEIGFPVMLRAAFSLGGLSSGVASNRQQVRQRAATALALSPQLLVEEYLNGWKEIEYEVVRDAYDNCITVCNMENLDPMGIHTGESIVVAPSQTLNNNEYHMLRKLSIEVVRHLGIVGECNIQFALDPHSLNYRVIEVNARLSRSSALASKATGYALAFIAAKLALGYAIPELKNAVTGVTMACFEPALDYVVVKVPRWDLQKFKKVSNRIGSGMKSVGEVMAIGRTFEEALQKALRMIGTSPSGIVRRWTCTNTQLEKELSDPTHERIYAISEAFFRGYSVEQVYRLSNIDEWFLYKIKNICEMAGAISDGSEGRLPVSILTKAKKLGFSDRQIAELIRSTEDEIRRQRWQEGIFPAIKQIDTLAAEYPAQTNYLYLTYNGQEDDIVPGGSRQVIVLGSGAYSIGSSVEFDWCCVNTVVSLRSLGYQTIVVNFNPETVSTDYSESDKLYFDELAFETIFEIYRKEQPLGIVISMGGQIPNTLALRFHEAGLRILGTSPEAIDKAEDRNKFSSLLDRLGILQPEWRELSSIDEARSFAAIVGYPVLVRPSYVLSGSAMAVASNEDELARALKGAVTISDDYPVVISKFIEDAKELDMDAIACNGCLVAWAISEHVENAGVHSGDATLVLPPQRTYLETIRRIRKTTEKIAAVLRINGPFNIQFIAKQNHLRVIECNLRASRSFPFVSKVLKINFIDRAVRVILGEPAEPVNSNLFDLDYVGVKAPQFSFMRLDDADPTLGVEMASTGEVGCLGDDFEEAFLKALLSVGFKIPFQRVFLSTGPVRAKAAFLEAIRKLQNQSVALYATLGTAEFYRGHGLETRVLHWPLDRTSPNIMEYIAEGKIDLVINIPKNFHQEELTNGYMIRRQAVNYGVPLITNIQLAQRLVEAAFTKNVEDLELNSWRQYQRDTNQYRICVKK